MPLEATSTRYSSVKGERLVCSVLTARLHIFNACWNASLCSSDIDWILFPRFRVGPKTGDFIFHNELESIIIDLSPSPPLQFCLPPPLPYSLFSHDVAFLVSNSTYVYSKIWASMKNILHINNQSNLDIHNNFYSLNFIFYILYIIFYNISYITYLISYILFKYHIFFIFYSF